MSIKNDPSPWPENWRELCNKSPRCHRCGIIFTRLYCLSERYPNIEVCANCSDDYHEHIKKFVDEITERKKND